VSGVSYPVFDSPRQIHGTGDPLFVLPGAYMTVELLGDLVPTLAKTRRVIAVQFQGYGHTPDIDRPISYEQFADDTAALLAHIGVEQPDVHGYSLGGGVALQLGLRHPGRIRKWLIASASSSSDGSTPRLMSSSIDEGQATTKRYGDHLAVDAAGLTVGEGELVGGDAG
jgi:pimeloyl-ACP methyl ester carboxylesterase